MTPEERRARNIALANTKVPKNPKIEEAFDDIWSGTEDLDRRGLSQQFIDCIKAVSHDFFETGVLWSRQEAFKEAVLTDVLDFSLGGNHPHLNIPLSHLKYHSGEKVKVLIYKDI